MNPAYPTRVTCCCGWRGTVWAGHTLSVRQNQWGQCLSHTVRATSTTTA